MNAARKPPYKIICISIFDWDLEELDKAVASLKERGLAKANRSWLIRHALSKVDVAAIGREDVYGE